MKMKGLRYLIILLPVIILPLFLCSCAISQKPGNSIYQEINLPHPWTDKPILDSQEKFQFAIISDLTNGRRPSVFEQAIKDINLMQPAFVMSIGDLTQGYTRDIEQIKRERDSFKNEVDSLDMRFYFVPGNHDITNSVMDNEWRQRYGTPYYHFIYKNVLFLCLDTEDPPDTQMSVEQVQYIKNVLEKNTDVRWTFVFMHKPMWLEKEGKEPGWQAISTILADRQHTIFAGHYHSYMYCKREGQDNIILATTGGESDLHGAGLGEFDHIVWVTVADKEPLIANLELGGILPKDIVTEQTAQINYSLFDASYLHADGIVSKEQIFQDGIGELTIVNPYPYSLKIEANFAEHKYVHVEPASFQIELLAGASKKVAVKAIALQLVELYELDPIILNLSATYQLSGIEPVTVPSRRLLDIHGTSEGPELISNGIFSGNGEPWFPWMHVSEDGSVSFSDGELKVKLKKSEAWWDAGIGQSVGGLKAGGRYKVSFKAANIGGAGIIHFQVGEEGKDNPATVIINGQPNQNEQIAVGNIMEKYTVEFVILRDADIAKAKVIFCLGELREASIDDISLREMMGEVAK